MRVKFTYAVELRNFHHNVMRFKNQSGTHKAESDSFQNSSVKKGVILNRLLTEKKALISYATKVKLLV